MTEPSLPEYAPLAALEQLIAQGGKLQFEKLEAKYSATVTYPPTDESLTQGPTSIVTAPSLSGLLRALALVPSTAPTDGLVPRICVGADGELVDATPRDVARWSFVQNHVGPVLELTQFPDVEVAADRIEALASEARLLALAANGIAPADHLLRRAAMGLDCSLGYAKGGHMPSAALVVCLVAEQFDQSADGESFARTEMIWTPINNTPRFDLPEPWSHTFAQIVAISGERFPVYGRGGAFGDRFLFTQRAMIRVDERTYDAAGKDGFRTLKPATASWADKAATTGDPLSLDAEPVLLESGNRATAFGTVWVDTRYVALLRELGVEHVFVSKTQDSIVAPETAIIMGLPPSTIQTGAGQPADVLEPRVGDRYFVRGCHSSESLIRITYVSEQRLLAVCEARRGGIRGDSSWQADGLEAEWTLDPRRWCRATPQRVHEIQAGMLTACGPSASDAPASGAEVRRM